MAKSPMLVVENLRFGFHYTPQREPDDKILAQDDRNGEYDERIRSSSYEACGEKIYG